MKKILFAFLFGLSLVVFAALPESENFAVWNKTTNLPEGWSMLQRKDRSNTVVKTGNGILLNGMIRTKCFPTPKNAKDILVRLKTGNVKNFLKVYLFYYYNPGDKYFSQVGQVYDIPASQGKTDIVSLKLSNRGQKYYALVLDGDGAEVESIEISPVEKKEVRKIPCEIPVIYNAKAPDVKKINPAEWNNSFTFENPFRSTMQKINFLDGETISLQTDGKKIYVLFSTQNYRTSKRLNRDGEVYKDSSVELVFQPVKEDRKYHIVANWAGVLFDEEVAVGQRFENWTCDGIEVGTARKGKTAYLAFSIPFTSLKINPDDGWSMNICRNRPEHSEFSTMNQGEYFANLMNAKVVRDLTFCRIKIGKLGKKLIFEANVKDSIMEVAEYGGMRFSDRKKTSPDAVAGIVSQRQDIIEGTFELTLSKNGKRYFRTDVQFGNMELQKEPARETHSHFTYYPIQKKVGVVLQGLSFKQIRELARVECFIGKDKVVLDKFRTNRGTVVAEAPYGIPADGTYQWNLKVIRKDGSVMEENNGEFKTKKNFEWLGNNLGKDRIVIPPFTKMTVNGNTVSCTLRDTKFSSNGFPESIIAAGKEVLSSPIKLYYQDAAGKEHAFAGKGFKITSQADDRVEMSASSTAGLLSTDLTAWMEYDGVFYYTMNLKAEKPVEVKKLYLEVPVEKGDLFHAVGASFRSHVLFWRTKDLVGNGVIWKSSQYPVGGAVTGSFLPSVWLGTFKNGISFFAESDKGWINSRKSDCIELIRRNGKIVLRINFVAKSATLKAPRKLEFGFVATPLKKRPVGAEDKFQWGTSFSRTFFNKGLITIDPYISNMMLNPNRKYSYVVYTAGQEYIEGDPEFQAFAVELDKEYKPTYNPWEVPLLPFRYGGMEYADYTSRIVVWNSYRVDFMLWRLNRLLRDTDIDGIYQDNSYASFCQNLLLKDQTFIRDDGKVQGIYHFLQQREYLKRCAVLAYKYNKRYPRIVLHNTGAMMPAAFAFVDGFMDGEVDVTKYYSTFPMQWNDIMLGVDWGVIPGRLTMLGPHKKDQNRPMFSIFKLYDMRFWITHGGFDNALYAKIRKIEREFGTGADGIEFFGYWQEDNPVKFVGESALSASCYRRKDGALLIYVSNTTGKTASGTLKFNQKMAVTNAFTGAAANFPITLPKEDFTAFLAIPEKK
ncbi:MAG: hypothetical protein E7040_05320 [Lentisphaerae bacterium]|nr:hypothetical protein [Lentisphaerota bacterium]